VEFARTSEPEVILLDLGIRGMDGYETARRIRALAVGNERVLVALTGWSETEARDQTAQAGFDFHWVKPLDLEALQRIIEDLPQKPSARSQAATGVRADSARAPVDCLRVFGAITGSRRCSHRSLG